eukprot:s629_g9.t1
MRRLAAVDDDICCFPQLSISKVWTAVNIWNQLQYSREACPRALQCAVGSTSHNFTNAVWRMPVGWSDSHTLVLTMSR